MLGFLNRVMKTFNDTSVMTSLYYSLVRSRLEYCSQIWAPSQQFLIYKIERVQRKFTRQLCFRSNVDYKDVEYSDRCVMFKLQTLHGRRQICDLVYLHKVINNKVYSTYLINEVSLYAPETPLRRKPLFYVKGRKKVRKDSFMPRALSLSNQYDVIDVFHFTSIFAFKRNARLYFF